MSNIAVISFNAGKLTPLIDARSDIEKYSFGCRILDNMIPRIYGAVERRPGTKYIANVQDGSVKSRMIAFIFSATIAYKLEFSNQIINVYFGDDLVDTVTSPYLEADLFQLQTEQSADVMWIVHPSYAQRKFSRVSATEFTLDTITFENGPFLERNDIAEDDGITITVTGNNIATVTTGAIGAAIITVTMGSTALATAAVALLSENQRFYITGSTSAVIDHAYTIDPLRVTTSSGATLTINPSEAITTDPATNGEVYFGGQTVTLTASSALFTTGDSGHTNALFKITHNRLVTATTGAAVASGIIGRAIDVKGNWTFTTSGNWAAKIELQRLEDGVNWETFRTYVSSITAGAGSFNAVKSDIEEANGIKYRVFAISYGAGKIESTFIVNESTQDSIYKITAVASTVSATATAIIAPPDNVAAIRWSEGSWSAVRGYPSAVTFFGERIIYGFTNSDQQNIWLSQVGEFEDFEAGINDADSFALTLPTANRGRWLASLETLAAGTTGGEWRIRASSLDEALTAQNFDIKIQTQRGSADMQALEVNDAILFIDFVARKIREFTFSDPKQKYVSPDLTALAEDITSGGITSVAVQRNPDAIIWMTIADSPYLISMTYEREQNVVAFSNHPLGGTGIAESVIVTPGTDEDIITLTVRRTIDSSTVRFIEEMQPRNWGSRTSATNSFFVDAGIVDTSGSTTITGLGHLEGETVSVLVDGAVQAEQQVSGGAITITETGDRVVVGLPCPYEVSPMRMDKMDRGGATIGSIGKISELVLSLLASGNVRYGDGVTDFAIPFRTEEVYGSPPDLFTGLTDNLAFDGGFSTEKPVVISGTDPLPCTLRAIIARTEKTGR